MSASMSPPVIAGVMPAWRRIDSASSARPVRAADPRRFRFKDDGGVAASSSSGRRFVSTARSRRGFWAPARRAAALGRDLAPLLLARLAVVRLDALFAAAARFFGFFVPVAAARLLFAF